MHALAARISEQKSTRQQSVANGTANIIVPTTDGKYEARDGQTGQALGPPTDLATAGKIAGLFNDPGRSSKAARPTKSKRNPIKVRFPLDPNAGIPRINGRRPINSRYAGKQHPSGIHFTRHGFPDFGPVAVVTVNVRGLTGKNKHDSNLANKTAGLKRTPEGYVWHHVENGSTMQLVPVQILKATRHTCGVAITKNKGFDK